MFLAILTALSAWPLLWGYRGLGFSVSKFQSSEKSANSCDENWVALSETTVCGIPCLENIVFSFSTTCFEVWLANLAISI